MFLSAGPDFVLGVQVFKGSVFGKEIDMKAKEVKRQNKRREERNHLRTLDNIQEASRELDPTMKVIWTSVGFWAWPESPEPTPLSLFAGGAGQGGIRLNGKAPRRFACGGPSDFTSISMAVAMATPPPPQSVASPASCPASSWRGSASP
jgi:hypothetical protein